MVLDLLMMVSVVNLVVWDKMAYSRDYTSQVNLVLIA